MSRRSISCAIALSICVACGGPAPEPDAGADAAVGIDAAADASGDAGPDDGCIDVTVESWRLALLDDTSIVYRARIAPDIESEPWDLYLEFRRFAVDYVGTFPLGEDGGMDANYSDCAHCVVAFYGTGVAHGFFARSGSMTLGRDPFEQHLDVVLEDVVLEEVTIGGETLMSTPVPDGLCLSLARTTVTQTFPPSAWSCPAGEWDDGETCHCACGATDPDCGAQCTLPPDPGCDPTPLPVENCGAGDMCTYEGQCFTPCSFAAREGCDPGDVCGFSFDGDRCFDTIDPAPVGGTCGAGALLCGADEEGFAMGVCDIDSEQRCSPACDGDDDCTIEGDICWSIFVDPTTGVGQGFCRPAPPPCVESGGSCSDHLDCCTVLCEGAGGAGTCA